MIVLDVSRVHKVGEETPNVGPRPGFGRDVRVAHLFLEVCDDAVAIVQLPVEEHKWPKEYVYPQKLLGN
jgi:hypothetical protein